MRCVLKNSLSAAVAVVAVALISGAPPIADAAQCDPGKPGAKLTGAEARKVYDCIEQSLYDGYQKGKKLWISPKTVKDYRTWKPVSSIPAAPGVHGNRFLFTYVNPVGANVYLKYASGDIIVPAGTLIAKESFSITNKGKVKKGPLFFMEKVAAGKSPKTNDWYYYAVTAAGAPMGEPAKPGAIVERQLCLISGSVPGNVAVSFADAARRPLAGGLSFAPDLAGSPQTGLVRRRSTLRQCKYLNNIIEQDHRFIKRRVRPMLGFTRFHTAWRTLRGIEMMNSLRKGQARWIAKGHVVGQTRLSHQVFGVA